MKGRRDGRARLGTKGVERRWVKKAERRKWSDFDGFWRCGRGWKRSSHTEKLVWPSFHFIQEPKWCSDLVEEIVPAQHGADWGSSFGALRFRSKLVYLDHFGNHTRLQKCLGKMKQLHEDVYIWAGRGSCGRCPDSILHLEAFGDRTSTGIPADGSIRHSSKSVPRPQSERNSSSLPPVHARTPLRERHGERPNWCQREGLK